MDKTSGCYGRIPWKVLKTGRVFAFFNVLQYFFNSDRYQCGAIRKSCVKNRIYADTIILDVKILYYVGGIHGEK